MTDRRDQSEPFEQNLRTLLRDAELPAEPSVDQVRHWTGLASRTGGGSSRFLRWLRLHPVGKIAGSAAAVAALVIAAVVGLGPLTPNLSAEELQQVVDRTFDRQAAVELTFHNLPAKDFVADGELVFIRKDTQAWLRLEMQPLPGRDMGTSTRLELRTADGEAWLLVEHCRQAGVNLLAELTGGAPLLLHMPLPPERRQTVEKALPERFEVTHLRAFVASLREAIPDMTLRRDGEDLHLTGRIENPDKLNARALVEALGWGGSSGRPGRLQTASGLIAPLRKQGSPGPSLPKQLSGAEVRIVVHAPTGLLRRIEIRHIAPLDGRLSLRFHVRASELPRLPDPASWADRPGVVRMTPEQIFAKLFSAAASQPAE